MLKCQTYARLRRPEYGDSIEMTSKEKSSSLHSSDQVSSPLRPWVRIQQPHALVQWPQIHCLLVDRPISQHPQFRPQQPPRLAQSSRSHEQRYHSGSDLHDLKARRRIPLGMLLSNFPEKWRKSQYLLFKPQRWASYASSWAFFLDFSVLSLSSSNSSDFCKALISSCTYISRWMI